ncbi:MAG TPA: hypothetical protein VJ865_13745 [Gemmatimonadaceae bacterium]|nr:hypothetical protein [Gemmatimonadaceae bacterium]
MSSHTAKLHRAFEIRDELRDHLAELALAERPIATRNNAADSSNPFVISEWMVPEEGWPPFERAALLLGDVIHNLCAAMDHVVWHATPDRIREAKPRQVAFPLYDRADKYAKWKRDRQGWYTPEVIKVLDWAQPYTAGKELLHPLHILQYLSNTDKHQLLNIVSNSHVDLGATTVTPEPDGGINLTTHEGVFKPGDILARIEFKRPIDSSAVDIKPVFAYEQVVRYVDRAVKERWLPVGEALNEIGPMVVNTIEAVQVAHESISSDAGGATQSVAASTQ